MSEQRIVRSEATVANAALENGAASKARLRLWLKLLKISRLVEGDLRERLRERFETTLPRFDVLAALHRESGGLKMSELSSVLKVSNGNVTGIVDRLVADGLIVRVPVDNDRRATTVRLTKAGRDSFETWAAEHEGWISDLFGAVSLAQANELIVMLQQITDAQASRKDATR